MTRERGIGQSDPRTSVFSGMGAGKNGLLAEIIVPARACRGTVETISGRCRRAPAGRPAVAAVDHRFAHQEALAGIATGGFCRGELG